MHQKQGKLLVKKVSLNTRLSFNHMSNLRGSIFDQHQISDICRKTNITKKGVFQRLPHMTRQDFREQQTFLYIYKLDITSIGHDLSSENMKDCDVIICVSPG